MRNPEQDVPAYFAVATFEPVTVNGGPGGMQAAWLRLESLPLDPALRPRLAKVVESLQERAAAVLREPVVADVYLQMTQLERPNGALLISQHASRWAPRLGLGVWPDREPPMPLSKEDFLSTLPGQQLREAGFHVRRIDADGAVAHEVVGQMAGSGALLVQMAELDAGDSRRKQVSEYLEVHITADPFRGFPMYVPLLDAASLAKLTAAELETCLAGVFLYLREDLSERAVLLVSRLPLEELFAGIYFHS